ncbi:MAG: DUF429 domain-containing protein [Desulfurococcaceae archaeon]
MVICAGIDLAASETRISGVTLAFSDDPLDIKIIKTAKLYKDREILETAIRYKASLVAVDSPLSLPLRGNYREVDLKLKRMGFNVLPPSWSAMRALTARASRLVEAIRGLGAEAVETHPSSCLKSSGCESLEELLGSLGISIPSRATKHERDSIIASIACVFYSFNRGLVVRASDGAVILLPKICQ